MEEFTVIAITPPLFFKGESEIINRILSQNEAQFVHIRKPGSSISDVEKLICEVDSRFYIKLKIHDHFDLAAHFGLGGVHLNSRCSVPPKNSLSTSKSLHSIEELEDAANFDYCFLSPIFDSISKQGYKAKFNLKELTPLIRDKNIIALGGVTPLKFSFLKELGFKGGALLSHFFPFSSTSVPHLLDLNHT